MANPERPADGASEASAPDASPGAASPPEPEPSGAEDARERGDRKLSDFLRRAVAAGFEVAGKGKDDLMRAAAGEVKTWLDRMDLDAELAKALTRLVVEVKAEIRFKPSADGKVEPVAETDFNLRKTKE
jgi:hypothetical protein